MEHCFRLRRSDTLGPSLHRDTGQRVFRPSDSQDAGPELDSLRNRDKTARRIPRLHSERLDRRRLRIPQHEAEQLVSDLSNNRSDGESPNGQDRPLEGRAAARSHRAQFREIGMSIRRVHSCAP